MTDPIRVHKRAPKPLPTIESMSALSRPRESNDDIAFTMFCMLIAAGLIVAAIMVPISIANERHARKASRMWCVNHGYGVANISQTKGGGKTQMRIDQIICVDDQRRMIFPGE